MSLRIIVFPFIVGLGFVLVTGGFHDGVFDFMWKNFPEYMMFFSVMGILIWIAVMVVRFFWRFQTVEKNVVDLNNKVDERFKEVDKRFEQVDKRFEQVDKRLDKMDTRFDRLDDKIGRIMEILIERKG